MTDYEKQKLRELICGMTDEERQYILEIIKEKQNEH